MRRRRNSRCRWTGQPSHVRSKRATRNTTHKTPPCRISPCSSWLAATAMARWSQAHLELTETESERGTYIYSTYILSTPTGRCLMWWGQHDGRRGKRRAGDPTVPCLPETTHASPDCCALWLLSGSHRLCSRMPGAACCSVSLTSRLKDQSPPCDGPLFQFFLCCPWDKPAFSFPQASQEALVL